MKEFTLGINVDHVATLRQARGTHYPDPVTAAAISELGGADQITIHLREDRRHIQERDLRIMRETVQTRLNLEMAATKEMAKVAYEFKPDMVTLVPEKREELTTEGGLDAAGNRPQLAEFCAMLADAGIRVSLFIDPEVVQLDAAREIGAPVVEIHTGRYADAVDSETRASELERIRFAVGRGNEMGLQVNAGHGLDYHNVKAVARIPGVRELNIGHAIVARALLSGLDLAVRDMKRVINEHCAGGA
jgi:pyridoxine 5-phosphate synthase